MSGGGVALLGGPVGVAATFVDEVIQAARRALAGRSADAVYALGALSRGVLDEQGLIKEARYIASAQSLSPQALLSIGVDNEVLAAGETAHAEYVEAFLRLEDVIGGARDCLPAEELEAVRASMAREMNRGIYAEGGGFVCIASERPTRGEVRLWLSGLASALAAKCQSSRVAALAEVVSADLSEPVARSSYLPKVLGAIGIVVLLAFLWGRA